MINPDHTKFEQFINHYWRYYKELEDEVQRTRRYVDFEEANFPAYSIEYLKLYQAICSEIDVIGKAIAFEIDNSFKAEDKRNNIYKWWLIVQNDIMYPIWNDETLEWKSVPLVDAEVHFSNSISIKPWANFATEIRSNTNGVQRVELVRGKQVPLWWSDYNKVKHNRTSNIGSNGNGINYSKANLGNVAKALSALYILEKSYMHAIGTKDDIEAFADESSLFCKIVYATSSDIDALFDFGDLDVDV